MQENNIIYEITRQIKDKDNAKKDIQQAFTLVSDMFKKKYIDKIDEEFKNRLKEIEKTPPKEIVLLNAIKPFLEKSNHKNIDNTINMLRTFSAINSFKNNFDEEKKVEIASNNVFFANSVKNTDPSVKEDGVYDIDENCIFGIKNTGLKSFEPMLLIMLFAIFFMNN